MFNLQPNILLARLIVVLLGIPIHEWAHCYAAHLLGDPTPQEQGRLTLNPITHLDPLGTLLILTTGFGWGKAALVNPHRMYKAPSPRIGMALTALAGPFSNFLQAIILVAALKLGVLQLLPANLTEAAGTFFFYAIAINVGLIAFNMLPFPPLDGSKVLAGIAPPPLADFLESLEPIAPLLLLVLLFVLPRMGIDVIGWMITPIYTFLYRILLW